MARTKTKRTPAKPKEGVTVISAPPPPQPVGDELITIQIVATRSEFRELLNDVSNYDTIGSDLHSALDEIVGIGEDLW